jgi:hypothetical protein
MPLSFCLQASLQRASTRFTAKSIIPINSFLSSSFSNFIAMKKVKALSLNKLRHFCFVLAAQILSVGLFAQVGPPNSGTALAGTTAYPWTSAAGTYTALTAGRTVWQSGATLSTNANSGQITLPWAFLYNNQIKNYQLNQIK